MKISYPADIQAEVLVVNDETGQTGKVTINVKPEDGGISDQTVRDAIKKFSDETIAKAAPGFRVASNREYLDGIMWERTGQIFAVAGVKFDDDIEGVEDKGFFSNLEMQQQEEMEEY